MSSWTLLGASCSSALIFLLTIHRSMCLDPVAADSHGRAQIHLGISPSPSLEITHVGLTVLLSPSMTCLLPVYIPFLVWQHCKMDSCYSASHLGMLHFVSISGRSSRYHMPSVEWVSFHVSRMIFMASFCILSCFHRLNCDRVLRSRS